MIRIPRVFGLRVVWIKVEEDQIAGNRNIAAVRFDIQGLFAVFQQFNPSRAVCFHRHQFRVHFRIMQTKRGEHGAPVAVGIAVPGAITGIPLFLAILCDCVIMGALFIAELAFRYGNHIFRPDAGQLDIGKGSLPDCLRFHIRFRVGETSEGMLVLFLLTDQNIFITGICMYMAFFALFLITDQNGLSRITLRPVGVGTLTFG